jgi:hypothetical protein
MKTATPQRTVTITIYGRTADDAQVVYSYWSPSNGVMHTTTATCDLTLESGTNTLFLLDYQTSLNGWTITGVEPNPAGAPALETIPGPARQSVMTMFPTLTVPQIFNFYIAYTNTLTGAVVRFDPQEKNIPTPEPDPGIRRVLQAA